MQIKNRIKPRKVLLALLLGALTLALSACGAAGGSKESPPPAPEANGDVYILFTSDVHCGIDSGDGYTMFDGAPLLLDRVKQDNHVLIDYITDTLGGAVGSEYADPYGQGRIVIVE